MSVLNTIYLSQGNIPEVFLKGTGAQDTFIDYMHSLVGKLLNIPPVSSATLLVTMRLQSVYMLIYRIRESVAGLPLMISYREITFVKKLTMLFICKTNSCLSSLLTQ